MVHVQVYEKYIQFTLICMTDNILPSLPIKHLVNQVDEPTTPKKLATGTKPSVSNPSVLLCPCVVQNATSHIDKKGVKCASSIIKGFLWHLRWNPKI